MFSPVIKENVNQCCCFSHPGPKKEETDNGFLHVNYSCLLQARLLKKNAIATLREEREHILYFSGKCRKKKSTCTAVGSGAGTQNRTKAP